MTTLPFFIDKGSHLSKIEGQYGPGKPRYTFAFGDKITSFRIAL